MRTGTLCWGVQFRVPRWPRACHWESQSWLYDFFLFHLLILARLWPRHFFVLFENVSFQRLWIVLCCTASSCIVNKCLVLNTIFPVVHSTSPICSSTCLDAITVTLPRLRSLAASAGRARMLTSLAMPSQELSTPLYVIVHRLPLPD